MADETEVTQASSGAEATVTKPVAKGSFARFMMIFLFMLALLAIIDPTLSQGFGAIAGYVLFPLIGFGGHAPVITILLAGALTTTVSSLLRDHYTDWIKMIRSQRRMAAWQKAQREAMRKGNKGQMDKLNKIRQEFMKDQMDIQVNSMKPLAWTFFLFIVLFAWLSVFVNSFLAISGGQYLAVPWAPNVYLISVPFLLPAWVLLYSLLAIPIGQILTRVLKYIRFRKRLMAMGLPLTPEPPGAA